MDDEVKALIDQALENIIARTGSTKKIEALHKKHDKKLHFIPQDYRVFGGLLQSMNIQFGNFIEELMALIIKNDGKYEIVEQYSGKKSNAFKLSATNDSLIDAYISSCQKAMLDLEVEFPKLLEAIARDETEELDSFKHDIDVLFRDKATGRYYYLEVKYNDDHDTGKFVDINRKFIKTYAYLCRELEIQSSDELVPILFFFTNKRMKGNIYVPELSNIRRGENFFKEFLSADYEDVNTYLRQVSEDPHTLASFAELFEKVTKRQR